MRREMIESFVFGCFEARSSLEKLAAGLAAAREAKAAEIERVVRQMPASLQGSTRSDLLGKMQRESYREIEVSYLTSRKGIEEKRASLKKASAFWANAVAVLDLETVASPERAAVAANIANAGPATLKRLYEQATTNRDPILAAALIARVESLSPAERPGNIHDLAKLVEPEHAAKIRDKLRIAEINCLHAEQALDAIRPAPSTDKLSRGLRLRELGQREGDPSPPARPAAANETRAPTPRERIAAGLAAREGATP